MAAYYDSDYNGYYLVYHPIATDKRTGQYRVCGRSFKSKLDALRAAEVKRTIPGNTKEARKQWLINSGYLRE